MGTLIVVRRRETTQVIPVHMSRSLFCRLKTPASVYRLLEYEEELSHLRER